MVSQPFQGSSLLGGSVANVPACRTPSQLIRCYRIGDHTRRFSGFHTDGGRGAGISLPPRNFEIEYGYYCFVTGSKQQSCPRLHQKQSERI